MDDILKVYAEEGHLRELPVKASPFSAGLDVRAVGHYCIAPGEVVLIRTGLFLAIPEGYEIEVRPRSGLSIKTRLRLPNSPGTIDADFRDEIKIVTMNAFSQAEIPATLAENPVLSEHYGPVAEVITLQEYCQRKGRTLPEIPSELAGQKVYLNAQGDLWGSEYIHEGDRIAQLLLKPCPEFAFIETPCVKEIGFDRGGGFGHSGRS